VDGTDRYVGCLPMKTFARTACIHRLIAPTILVAALVGCGSTGSVDGIRDGAIEGAGDDVTVGSATDDAALERPADATGEPDTGSARDADVIGDAMSEPAPAPDAASPNAGDAASPDGGACPSSCTTFTDCNSCPQKAFGGWSCNNGICQFMG
jgi:hypothetical protein